MLFLVIERFRGGDPGAVGARFREKGRLMPPDVAYVASWFVASGAVCYQLMEAPNRSALEPWIAAWNDLVDFEIEEVLSSADFWARRAETTSKT